MTSWLLRRIFFDDRPDESGISVNSVISSPFFSLIPLGLVSSTDDNQKRRRNMNSPIRSKDIRYLTGTLTTDHYHSTIDRKVVHFSNLTGISTELFYTIYFSFGTLTSIMSIIFILLIVLVPIINRACHTINNL